jgi:ubiquitin-like protein Pup
VATRLRKDRPRSERWEEEPTPEQREQTKIAEVKARVTEELDGLLEEIDSVLEKNADEFVAQYVQKGGE